MSSPSRSRAAASSQSAAGRPKQVSADVKSKLALLLRRRIGSQREDKDFDRILRQKNIHIFAFSMTGLLCMMITAVATWFISARRITQCELSGSELPSNLVNLVLDRANASYCPTLVSTGCGCYVDAAALGSAGILSPSSQGGASSNASGDLCYFAVPKDAYHDDDDVSNTLLNVMYLAQAVISSTTIVTVALIAQKYRLLLLLKRAEWSGANLFEVEGFRGDTVQDTQQRDNFNRSYDFWGSSMKWYFLAEVAVHLPHPILWMATEPTGNYTQDQIPNLGFKLLQVIMFLRLYLLPNILHIFSDAYINRFEIVSSHKEMQTVGFQIRASLTLKMFFYDHTALTLIFLAAASLLIFGYTIFSLERIEQWTGGELTDPSQCRLFKNFGSGTNSFWWAYVTFSTMGYGEFVPATTFGRITAAVCAVVGITAFIVFSAVLVSRVSLSKEQKHGVEYLHTRAADEEYRAAAEMLIKTACVQFIRNKRLRSQNQESGKAGGGSGTGSGGGGASGAGSGGSGGGGSGGSGGSGSTAISIGPTTATHKANRVYYAIKRFRAARRTLEGSFMQAEDVVINQKLEAVEKLVLAIQRELAVHQQDFVDTEKFIETKMRHILNKAAKYRRQGHVVV